ncbi:hypothetical protein [Streptomyces sp. NPDC060188]|uniref:hypothetical protein n=1 Tax=Streptomyces sp. NPDC060188 TaxID=3347068 RepID=UPI003667DBD8
MTTPNTERIYASFKRQFATWCASEGRLAVPCSSDTLLAYMTYLIEQRALTPVSVNSHLAGIRSGQPTELAGLAEARTMLREWQARWSKQGGRQQKALPASAADVRAMVRTCSGFEPADLRDGTLLLLAWGTAAQAESLARIEIRDLQVASTGVTVSIPATVDGKPSLGDAFLARDEDTSQDPVFFVREWLSLLEEGGVTDGPLFKQINRHGTVLTAQGSTLLGRDSLRSLVQRRAQRAGLENWKKIGLQSLRTGSAVTRVDLTCDEDALAIHGHWRPASSIVGY